MLLAIDVGNTNIVVGLYDLPETAGDGRSRLKAHWRLDTRQTRTGDEYAALYVPARFLPQVNPRNEQLKACLQGAFGAGYDYTYLYPGIQKVVQAAGRVIRTQEDRGVVYLIDDRFARPAVRELLPAWWRIGA